MASIIERFGSLFQNNPNVSVKDKRFVIKAITDTGPTSFVVPSRLFPLENTAKIDVFTYGNTQLASSGMLQALDHVHYNIGQCYQNSGALEAVLKGKGIKAQMYSGWYFLGFDGPPIHHSWVVVDDIVLDLSNDRTLLINSSYIDMMQGKSRKEAQKVYLDYMNWALKLPNHIRCKGAGKVKMDELYIGCPSTLEKATLFASRLYDEYPGHPSLAKGTNCKGYSPMQQLLWQKGLI